MKTVTNILSLIAAVLTTLLFAEPLYDAIYAIGYMMFCHVHGVCFDILISILALVCMVYTTIDGWGTRYKQIHFRRVVLGLCLCGLYLYARIVHADTFAALSICDTFAYADLLLLSYVLGLLFPWLLKLILKENEQVKVKSKFPDCICNDDIKPEDKLGRKQEVQAVYKYLLNNSNDNSRSLAIAITGTWGSGKTTFLSYFKDCLETGGYTYFDYNPWNRTNNNVTLDFLTHLESRLHKEGVVTNGLRRYIDSIKVSNATGWFSLGLNACLQLLTDRPTCTQDYIENVRKEMNFLKKPVIAFVDDVDRVSADDFRDILGVIRSTADLPNLIYVVAYDNDRALDLLGAGGGKYLSKVFNVSHALQPVDEEVMQSWVGEALNEYFMHCGEDTMYENPLASIHITSYIQTLRDLKRLVNMMYKDYKVQEPMRSETFFDFDFWANMELLKFHDYVSWTLLQSQPRKYLDVIADDWNTPASYKVKQSLELSVETKDLLTEMFDIRESIFRSPDYLPLIFANNIDHPFLSNAELRKAIDSGVASLYKPTNTGCNQNMYVSLLNTEFLSLQQIIDIITSCVQDDTDFDVGYSDGRLNFYRTIGESVSQIEMANVRKVNSPYRKVTSHHELYLIFDKYITQLGAIKPAEFLDAIKDKKVGIREMMAVVYGLQQMDLSNGNLPPQWKVEAALDLAERLLHEYDMKELINQFYMMEAFEFLHVYDHVNMFVMPVVKKNPAQWLRLSIRVCTTVTESLLLADVDVLRTMFDTYEVYNETMKAYEMELCEKLKIAEGEQKTAIEYNLRLIKEHRELVKKSELIGVYSEGVFEDVNFPTLKEITCSDCTSLFSMGAFYKDLAKRLLQKDVPFYFGKSRHPQLFE